MFRLNRKTAVVLFVVIFMCINMVFGATGSDEGSSPTFTMPDTASVKNNSNRRTQAEPHEPRYSTGLDTEGFELMMENDRLEVWFREETAGIRVRDKISGYVWGGLSEDKVDGMNRSWSAMANAMCSIEYYDAENNEKRVSLSNTSAEVDYIWEDNLLTCNANFTAQGISFTFTMELLDDGLKFDVVGDVVEEGDNLIKSLYFVPFIGCVKEDSVDGYMFVPDGPGALIRYNVNNNYIAPFDKRIYGLDMGFDELSEPSDLMVNRPNDFLIEEPQITLPVYGMVHGAGKNAVFAVVEDGDIYANIVAYPAGVITDYNWVAARFNYRMIYTKPYNKKGQGILVPQEEINPVKPSLRLYFLTGDDANYSGMARIYRSKLIKKGIISIGTPDKKDIPLRLDVLGADVKKGLLISSLQVLTTANEAKAIAQELYEKNIENLKMIYLGWQVGGLNGSKYGTTSFEGRLGGKSGVKDLKDYIEQKGGSFSLYVNPVTVNETQMRTNNGAALTITKRLSMISHANPQVMFPDTYFVRPRLISKTLDSIFDRLDGFKLSIGQLGQRLYSDYSNTTKILRHETLILTQETLKKAAGKVDLYGPNLYLLSYTDSYLDIPLVNSQYLFETDTVPFLQMVLKGSIDYYAPYANQSMYSMDDILTMIEFGAFPSFLIGAADNYALSDTPLEYYFSVNFQDWKDTILTVYREANTALSKVEGQTIEEHTVLETGLVKVEYSGGTVIYVNYNNEDKQTEHGKVLAHSYLVAGKGKENERKNKQA